MKRVVVLAAGLAAVIIAAAALLIGHRHTDRFRVAVIFDTAKGMVAGQQVKIAGAVVGRVDKVELAPGPKARLILSVDRRFAPFHRDASCRILPEGLISENFVACDPGTPASPPLDAVGALPTVPVTRTAVPTSLQDVLDVFALPTDDRLRVLITELGIATAGRGDDLNAILRRANPSLAATNRLLGLVNGQRTQLLRAVSQTDRVVGALARRGGDVRRFVDTAAATLATSGSRRRALAEAVHRLPPLLRAAQPALRALDHAADQGTPLLATLHAAAPGLDRVTRDLAPFSDTARGALRALAAVTPQALDTIRVATPLARHLRTAGARAVPFSAQLRELLLDTRDRGGIEGILRWFYSLSAASSAYDETSHLAGLLLRVMPQCVASATAPGCSTTYASPGQGTIPPDDPSCGPQNGAPWDPPTTCVSQVPTRARRTRPAARQPTPPTVHRPVPVPVRIPPLLPERGHQPGTPLAPVQHAVDSLLEYLLR